MKIRKLIGLLIIVLLISTDLNSQVPVFKNHIDINIVNSLCLTGTTFAFIGFHLNEPISIDGNMNNTEKCYLTAICCLIPAIYLDKKKYKSRYILRVNAFNKQKYITLIIKI